jgi:hypothetical protein
MNYKRNDAKKIYSSEKKYANILSYSEIGKKLLKKIKKEKNNNLSLFHNINKEYKYADEEEKLKLNYDIKAEKIYSYCYNK